MSTTALPNILDIITRRVSAFDSFDALLKAEGNYRPTIRCGKYAPKGSTPARRKQLRLLADAYDAAMQEFNDERRAFRG